MSNGNSVYAVVAEQIARLADDNPAARAALAKLRRGAGKAPGSVPDIWAYTIAPLEEETYDQTPTCFEWAVHVALTLYAVHRQGNRLRGGSGGTLGAAVARLRDSDNDGAITRRFNAAATASTPEELSVHARSLVQLLKAGKIDMDYPKFAKELFDWQFDPEPVRLAWGRDFYRQNRPDANDPNGNGKEDPKDGQT